MIATKNNSFPFVTISFATAHTLELGSRLGKLIGDRMIFDNTNPDIEIRECKDLVYHVDAETAKAYQKELSSN